MSTQRTVHDGSFSKAWDRYRAGKEETEGFDSSQHGSIAFSAFAAGWRARYDEAERNIRSQGSDDDFKVIQAQMELLEREYSRAWDEVMKYLDTNMKYKRIIERLRTQIEEMGGNPDEAPLYRRISNQRKELKALLRLIDTLQKQLQEKDTSVV